MPHDRSISYGSWLHCWRLSGIGNAGVWERRAQSQHDEAGIDDFPSESSIRREESHGAPLRPHRERRGIQRYQRHLEGCLRKRSGQAPLHLPVAPPPTATTHLALHQPHIAWVKPDPHPAAHVSRIARHFTGYRRVCRGAESIHHHNTLALS